MELPPFDLGDFNKWKGGYAIVKECDMDEAMKVDTKEYIVNGVEKSTGAEGVDMIEASKYIKE